jgi:L-amino acid N-acyltransferase YncA
MSARLTAADVTICPCEEDHVAAITTIYAHHVLHGLASFEIEPPSEDDMRRRRLVSHNYPYLVAECAGEVFGYAYASPYRLRPAYRHTAENSVYLRPAWSALLAECEARGLRQIVAVIGDSANCASIALHKSLGFREVGVLHSVGSNLIAGSTACWCSARSAPATTHLHEERRGWRAAASPSSPGALPCSTISRIPAEPSSCTTPKGGSDAHRRERDGAIGAAALVGPAQVAARLVEFGALRMVHPLVSARLAALLHPIGAVVLGLLGPGAITAFAVRLRPADGRTRRRAKNAAAQPVADRSEDRQRHSPLGDRQETMARTMQHRFRWLIKEKTSRAM